MKKKITEAHGKKGFVFLLAVMAFITYILANGVVCIPIMAWIYPILFLKLYDTESLRKPWLMLTVIYAVGFVIRFYSVIGMNVCLCAAVAVILALFRLVPYFLRRKKKKDFCGTLIYASATTVVEYFIYFIYPILGGLSDAYTQHGNHELIQLVTLTGIYGIVFFINWTAAMVWWIWDHRAEHKIIRKYGGIYCLVAFLIFLYGAVMYYFPKETESVRVAGVTVPVSDLLNEDEDVYAVFYTNAYTEKNKESTKIKLAGVSEELFEKTICEAQAGAKMVVWSELNGAVLKEDENKLLQKASAIAKEQQIYLLMSLLVKTPGEDYKENKVVALNPQGEVVFEYYKFGRSIGELCQKGDGKLKYADTEYGRIAAFICSDMAFASKVRQTGRAGIDLLLIPASDWKAMTEIAMKTAIVRGIENGCHILRQTNCGISLVADFRGNIVAKENYFQSDTMTMAVQIPKEGRFTVYAYIGDVFAWLCGGYLIFIMLVYKRVYGGQPGTL
ncbi:MAG: hypothetical protein GX567_02550 [Clostridia bacterium]|nr:hypothetical protein [Clostridia bacterium]